MDKKNALSTNKWTTQSALFLCKNTTSLLQKQWVRSRQEFIGWVQYFGRAGFG
jgi:hypothetical protein